MKRAAILTAALMLLACADPQPIDTRHEEIRAVAEQGYAALIAGDVDAHMALMRDYDRMGEELREGMRQLLTHHLREDSAKHGRMVRAVATADTILDSITAHAFVQVTWADSTTERVLVPVVLQGGKWLLK